MMMMMMMMSQQLQFGYNSKATVNMLRAVQDVEQQHTDTATVTV
jgi:hypothetical protein